MQEVEDLSLDQLVGQLLVVGFDGPRLPEELRADLGLRRLGGLIVFGRNVESVPQVHGLCAEVQRASDPRYPAWIGVDQEGGRVARLREGVVQLPPMRWLGALDDVSFTAEVAAEQARQLVALGFNVNFAPVADVDSNPDNPVIGDRSFSSDPAVVTRHCIAMCDAMQQQGLAACLKHFPGHGDTAVDSHLSLPTVSSSALSLRRTELYPFERACRKAATVMSAHVVFSALDDKPATHSPRLLQTLLRREFAFEGVVFSDDMEMGAMAQRGSIEDNAVKAVEAGCDTLLICRQRSLQERAHQALRARAEADDSFRARCKQAARRNLVGRRRFAPVFPLEWPEVNQLLRSTAGQKLSRRLSRLKAEAGSWAPHSAGASANAARQPLT